MTDRDDGGSNAGCGCKVGRVAERYDLPGLDDALVARWTGEAGERDSTRELETWVNRRILAAALEAADVPVRDGEVENTYRLLTDEDVSSGTRVKTRRELERDGVPVDAVESDFVSHQTVYTHLTTCLEASLEPPSEDERLERSAEKLGALQNRTVAVTTDTIEQLERNGVLEVGEFDVFASVTVTCEGCLKQYAVSELLERGGCECRGRPEE